ncbi:MAG: hypothetical protein M0P94_03695 [Candidatus Absconditabacterales bacterium]|nr:hypothetical protein [Candidatus Absconditabacterales bacterium]
MKKLLNTVNYFTNFDLSKFINKKNVNVYLDRYKKKNLVYRIKQGIYVTRERIEYIEKLGKKTEYLSFLATSVMVTPSYLSSVYILSINNILTESAFSMTMVTTKNKKVISNDFGVFSYQNISEELFRGYERKEEFGFIYYRAYPEKALLDRLWLKKDIHYSLDYFKELRLNIDLLNFKRLEKFVKQFNRKKIEKCFYYLKQLKGF